MLQSSWERFQFFRTFLSSFALHFVPTNSKQQMPTWRKAIQCYLGPRAWKQSQKNIILQFKQYYMKNFISSLISSSKVKKKKRKTTSNSFTTSSKLFLNWWMLLCGLFQYPFKSHQIFNIQSMLCIYMENMNKYKILPTWLNTLGK